MILELLSSSAVGTALGGVFSWLTRVEERKALAAKNEHDRAMLSLQMQGDADKAKSMLELAKTQGELTAFAESQKTGFVQSGIKAVDAIVSLMRPALNVMLFAMTCAIAYSLHIRTSGQYGMDPVDAAEMYKHLVYECVFLTSTAIAWWFGARGTSVRAKK